LSRGLHATGSDESTNQLHEDQSRIRSQPRQTFQFEPIWPVGGMRGQPARGRRAGTPLGDVPACQGFWAGAGLVPDGNITQAFAKK